MLIFLNLRVKTIPHIVFIHISGYLYSMFIRSGIIRFIPIYYFMEMHDNILIFILLYFIKKNSRIGN